MLCGSRTIVPSASRRAAESQDDAMSARGRDADADMDHSCAGADRIVWNHRLRVAPLAASKGAIVEIFEERT